jgi:KUP system potassium uptake protein
VVTDDLVRGSGATAAGTAQPEGADTATEQPHGQVAHAATGGLVLAALGIVFGDIGTSPLYALQTVFSIDDGAVRPTIGDVYGVISMMFW